MERVRSRRCSGARTVSPVRDNRGAWWLAIRDHSARIALCMSGHYIRLYHRCHPSGGRPAKNHAPGKKKSMSRPCHVGGPFDIAPKKSLPAAAAGCCDLHGERMRTSSTGAVAAGNASAYGISPAEPGRPAVLCSQSPDHPPANRHAWVTNRPVVDRERSINYMTDFIMVTAIDVLYGSIFGFVFTAWMENDQQPHGLWVTDGTAAIAKPRTNLRPANYPPSRESWRPGQAETTV